MDEPRGRLAALAPAAVAVSLLAAAGGCATRGDVEALRAEAAGLRSAIGTADARASRAEEDAQRAAAAVRAAEEDARATGAGADRAFREGLRK
jgi:hypothetical protein